MAKNTVHLTMDPPKELDGLLAQLPLMLRNQWLDRALKRGGRIIQKRAKELCPKGGPRIGVKAGKKHLRDTIAVVHRRYKGGSLLETYIGPEYPAGAHGHLVEFGHAGSVNGRGQHDSGGRVPPHPFMRPAFDESKNAADQAIVDEMRKEIESVKGMR